jgi:hypothetical protein
VNRRRVPNLLCLARLFTPSHLGTYEIYQVIGDRQVGQLAVAPIKRVRTNNESTSDVVSWSASEFGRGPSTVYTKSLGGNLLLHPRKLNLDAGTT